MLLTTALQAQMPCFMKNKIAFLLGMFVLVVASAHAQGSNASQNVQLQLSPAIEISSRPSYSNINISSAGGREFRVKANKAFNVNVSTQSTTDALLLAIKNNETGGMASEGFTAYAPVQASAQGLLSNCSYGNDRSFAVNYKCKNDAVLVYTATQP